MDAIKVGEEEEIYIPYLQMFLNQEKDEPIGRYVIVDLHSILVSYIYY